MSELKTLRDAVTPAAPADAGTVIAADEAAALEALSAYFGAGDERRAARVVVGGVELGYVDRDRALDVLDVQSRDLGGSSGWALPGISDYQAIELRCAVDGCAANPIFAVTFDSAFPPDCPLHPGQALSPPQ